MEMRGKERGGEERILGRGEVSWREEGRGRERRREF